MYLKRVIVVGDSPPEFSPSMFIAKDPPIHTAQRKAAMPAVAKPQLADIEPLIRQRTGDLLESLPIGEEFNWDEKVSIDLTAQLLATLFDFPWEERQRILLECLEYFQNYGWSARPNRLSSISSLSLGAHSRYSGYDK